MKITLFFALIFSVLGGRVAAQQAVSGKIISEEGNFVSGVIVVNLQNKTQVKSDAEGVFSIKADVGDEIRFASSHYQRLSVIVQTDDFSKNLTIKLSPLIINIEGVNVSGKNGDYLDKDGFLGPMSPKKIAMENKIKESVWAGDDHISIKPKMSAPVRFMPNIDTSFGMFGSKKGYASSTEKYVEWVKNTLGDDYFISMGIPERSIRSFIQSCLHVLDMKKIVRFGKFTNEDLSKLQLEMEVEKDAFLKTKK